jgi:hypothetical protein
LLQLKRNQTKEFPLRTSNKAAFVVSSDPTTLIARERENRSWMKHSVVLLIVSPKVDQIALVLPRKVADRGESHVRTPPQQALPKDETVNRVALEIVRTLVTQKVSSERLQFLGSTRGNVNRGGQQQPYGKWVHWVGVRLEERNGVFTKDPASLGLAHWCHTNQLLSMDTYAMSERKYMMTLQALAAFNTLGVDGTITRRAKEKLAA